MKNVQQNLKRWPGILGMVCLLAIMLSSCIKDHNANTPVQPIAGLAVIDASADAPALDFYLNNDRVNANSLTAGNFINYFNAYAGKRNAVFFDSGTSTIAAQDTINLLANKTYSLFLAGTIANAQFILLNDSVSRPASGSGSIRFVNASPDAGAVDLVIKGGATLATNITYKNASAFASIPPSVGDTLQVRQAGTSSVLATLPNTKFDTNTVYTVWLSGLANTAVATQQLKTGIMVNAYFY